jgi:hypothetical protein
MGMPRFRVKTLMIAVAATGIVLGLTRFLVLLDEYLFAWRIF